MTYKRKHLIRPLEHKARKTHCKWGHAFLGDNIYWAYKKPSKTSKGYWYQRCKACHLEAVQCWEEHKRGKDIKGVP
jgi:Pyruvate/2-oxoacid:ferredoxin oxidoreductase delta subunit